MLDRSKLLHEIECAAERLFYDATPEIEVACRLWERMAHDPLFFEKVQQADAALSLPHWQGVLDTAVQVAPVAPTYTVVAVDGSQIYPDRHQGSSCFLINIGLVLLRYGLPAAKRVELHTIPYLFVGDEDPLMQGSAIDFVNGQREAYEFSDALTFVQERRVTEDKPLLLLFDGSLIFWHLESKDHALRNYFLGRYCSLLEQLATQQIPYASYLSLPRNKELVSLVRFAEKEYLDSEPIAYEQLVDVHLVNSFLPPGYRTTLFEYRAPLVNQYAPSIRPYYCYMNVGQEIARIELPAWLATDEMAVDAMMRIILDQAQKGQGYPVALAESHEQAVVKGADRDFFYYMIRRVGSTRQQRCQISQKSLKKRTIGI
jgi:hypothetical protein